MDKKTCPVPKSASNTGFSVSARWHECAQGGFGPHVCARDASSALVTSMLSFVTRRIAAGGICKIRLTTVAAIFSTVLATVDSVRDDGSGADHRRGAGHRRTDDTSSCRSCRS
jgi:hypothetical protein